MILLPPPAILILAAPLVKTSSTALSAFVILPLLRLELAKSKYRSKYDCRIALLVSLCGLAVKNTFNAEILYDSRKSGMRTGHRIDTRSESLVSNAMIGRNASFPLFPAIIVDARAITPVSDSLCQRVVLSPTGAVVGNAKYLNSGRVKHSLPFRRQ